MAIGSNFGLDDEEILSNMRKEAKALKKKSNVTDNDYDIARLNLKELLGKGSIALEELMLIAKTTENPSVYRVLAELIDVLGKHNVSLADVRMKEDEVRYREKRDTPTIQHNTQNNLYVTTSELQKMLKDASTSTPIQQPTQTTSADS